ncbi:MAG TPA: hypothetical protein VGM30_01355 [Puia sp.]
MKTRIILLIPLSLLLFFIMACNLEVNTSDPQASSDIKTSKQGGFFITDYFYSPLPTNMFNISEVWVESIWFNKIRDGKVVKEKSDGLQLNLKLNEFSNPDFADDKYILNWEMKDGVKSYHADHRSCDADHLG